VTGIRSSGESALIWPPSGRPELAPVLDRLWAEHQAIAVLLAHLQRVLGDVDLDKAALQTEVDRLTTQLERHLDHEEDKLIPVLDAAT
jgi:hemerythrin-like domain-containing protein